MYEDPEKRLRDAGGAVEPSRRPGAQRARAAALNELSAQDAAMRLPKRRHRRERIASAVVPRGRRAVTVVASLALVLVATAGAVTGGLLGGGDEESPPVAIVGAAGSEAWPADTLQNWVSYADQLSVVSVTEERALPPPPGADPATDADYVAREVTLKVERTPWRREQAPTTDGGTVSVVALGWVEREGDARAPFRIRGGNRLEVGERYLLPLVKAEDGWSLFSSRAVLALDGDQVSGKVDVGEPSAALARLAGTSIDRAGEIVRATEPDPLAAKYDELPPAKRWQAADAARESAAP